MGQPGAVPAGRAAPAAVRRRSPARLLQRQRPALGQPGLRLGRAASDRLPLVHRPPARLARPRGRRFGWITSAGSRPPGTCRPGRRRPSRAHWVPGPGAEFFSAVEQELGASPVHRRGPGNDHAGCLRAPRPLPRARDAGPPVRLRRPSGQSVPAAQLRPEHGGVYRHPRQQHDLAAGSRICRRTSDRTSGAT